MSAVASRKYLDDENKLKIFRFSKLMKLKAGTEWASH